MKNGWTEQEIRERQSISTYVYRNYRPLGEAALEELASFGIRRIELLQSQEQFDLMRQDSMNCVRRSCDQAGVAICAYHANSTDFSDIGSDQERMQRIDTCKRQIDTLLELGGRIWGSHARLMDANGQYCVEQLLQHIEGTDCVIVLENFNRDQLHLEDRIEFLNRMDHPQLGLLLDIGHVRNDSGENPMTLPGGPSWALDLCRDRLFFLHLHGFVAGTDHYPPFAEGDGIQWQELFQKLFAIGYNGFFNFEPKGPAFFTNTLELTSQAPKRVVSA